MTAAKSLIPILVLACVVGGCASTSITSQADVTAKAATYDTVMVIAEFDDLDMRRLCEAEMKRHLALYHVVCLPSSELFFPGTAYSVDEMRAKLAELRVAGILVMSAYGGGEASIPATYYTQGTAWVSGAVAGVGHASQSAKFRAELIDVRGERSVWVSTANSKAAYLPFPALTDYATGHTLLRSFCGQVMNKLVEDGVVKPSAAAHHTP